MNNHDIPPQVRRRGANRLAEAPILLWAMLAVVLLLGVVALFVWGLHPPALGGPGS